VKEIQQKQSLVGDASKPTCTKEQPVSPDQISLVIEEVAELGSRQSATPDRSL